MWISALDVRGFKHLHEKWILNEGLTVVTGPNEAGKSTLHEILVRVLFGFSKSERRKRPGLGTSVKDVCRPWSGSPFAVNARFEGVSGRSFVVEWDFDLHAVTLRDAETGEDFSNKVRGKREEVVLGEFLLQIGIDEFEEACCLHQETIAAVTQSEELALALRRSVESGTPDVGIQQADGRLTEYLRDRLGVHSGHYGELREGTLAAERVALEDLEAELMSCVREREEVATIALELEGKQNERNVSAEYLDTLTQRLLVSQLSELESRFERARALQEGAATRPVDPAVVSGETVREVDGLLKQRRSLCDQIEALARATEEARSELESLQARHAQAATEADGLAHYSDVMAAHEEDVRGGLGRITGGPPEDPEREQPLPERDPALAGFREERERLVELASRPDKIVWDKLRIAIAAVVSVLSVGLGVAVHPAGFAGLILAGVALATVRGEAADKSELPEALGRYSATSLDELDRRARNEDRRIAMAEATLQERARAHSEADALRARESDELTRVLEEAGAPTHGSLTERASAYLLGCEKHRQLIAKRGELGVLEASIATRGRSAQALAERRRELAAVEEALASAFRSLEISAADLDSARSEFEDLTERALVDQNRIAKADADAQALRALLADETTEQLEHRVEKTRARHREHVAQHGNLASEAEDAERLAERIGARERELRQVDVQIADLAARIDQRESRLADPATLREEIDRRQHALGHMERGRDAIRIARTSLGEAAREAHQEFAPRLKEALLENLSRITGGRYQEATVDEDLEIRVKAPETGRLVPVDDLSRGTRDQIYLVERLEIARLLDPTTGEAPLLLDDPFARFDDTRLRYGLEVVRDAAVQRQVLVFTEDRRVVELAQEVCPGCGVVELQGPPGDGQVPAIRSQEGA